jgi:hypothetical protein
VEIRRCSCLDEIVWRINGWRWKGKRWFGWLLIHGDPFLVVLMMILILQVTKNVCEYLYFEVGYLIVEYCIMFWDAVFVLCVETCRYCRVVVLLLTFPLKCLQIKFRILCARKIDFDS